MRYRKGFLVRIANYLRGAGNGFHKHVRKLTLVNYILDTAGLAVRLSEGVLQLGNPSST